MNDQMKSIELFTENAWPYILAIGFAVGCVFFMAIILWISWVDIKRATRKAERRHRKLERRMLKEIEVNDERIV